MTSMLFVNFLAMKHGDLELDLFSNLVPDTFIEVLCTNYFLLYAYFCVLLYDLHNKIKNGTWHNNS